MATPYHHQTTFFQNYLTLRHTYSYLKASIGTLKFSLLESIIIVTSAFIPINNFETSSLVT